MTARFVASRTFDLADQLWFAATSGDANPMHVDPLAARRTQFGEPLVHGVHGLLWGINAAAATGTKLSGFRGMSAQFANPILLGDEVEAHVAVSDADVKIELRIRGLRCTAIRLTRQTPRALPDWKLVATSPSSRRLAPQELDIEQMHGIEAALDYSAPGLAEAFPAAAQEFGAGVLEGLAASTYIVGMEAPGLRSIYSKLTAALDPQPDLHRVEYRVANADPRFRIADVLMRTPAMSARMNTFARVSPIAPASMADIRPLLRTGEFTGQRALVIGGSRGLGAATAKLIAAGGGDVTITYARGEAEAKEVAAEIQAAGGTCQVQCYDAFNAPSRQLDFALRRPNAIYYFATSTIWRRKTRAFEPSVLREFMQLHVEGFAALAEEARLRTQGRLALFYPSSTYAVSPPPDFGEYAAAKRAGEAIAENLAATLPDMSIVIERLPPIDTDQNASVTATHTISPIEAMLPVVRRMQLILQPTT